MHCLHKILVHVPDYVENDESLDEQKEEIRAAAEFGTEDFFEDVFDWRETDSAGRWQEEYPKQVYLASDDTDWFIKELLAVKSMQEGDIESCITQLRKTSGLDLEAIRKKIDEQGCGSMTAYYLLHLSKLLYGKYDFESGFYNLRDGTAKVSEEIIEEIKSKPKDWALVMFDYHD